MTAPDPLWPEFFEYEPASDDERRRWMAAYMQVPFTDIRCEYVDDEGDRCDEEKGHRGCHKYR